MITKECNDFTLYRIRFNRENTFLLRSETDIFKTWNLHTSAKRFKQGAAGDMYPVWVDSRILEPNEDVIGLYKLMTSLNCADHQGSDALARMSLSFTR